MISRSEIPYSKAGNFGKTAGVQRRHRVSADECSSCYHQIAVSYLGSGSGQSSPNLCVDLSFVKVEWQHRHDVQHAIQEFLSPGSLFCGSGSMEAMEELRYGHGGKGIRFIRISAAELAKIQNTRSPAMITLESISVAMATALSAVVF